MDWRGAARQGKVGQGKARYLMTKKQLQHELKQARIELVELRERMLITQSLLDLKALKRRVDAVTKTIRQLEAKL